MKKFVKFLLLLGVVSFVFDYSSVIKKTFFTVTQNVDKAQKAYEAKETEKYGYEVLKHNNPSFTKKEKKCRKSFEKYSDLDFYGRCGPAYINVCKKTMPKPGEKRGPIGMVKPSGWHTVKYDCVEGLYLYNRCHLAAFCLSGENSNEKNLITGTRYFNADEENGMLHFEMKVLDYMKKHPKNHVLYRVTPVFKGTELVARYVTMEAYSVEDKGKLRFNVKVYNSQPGIVIDYQTGKSHKK